MIDLIWFLVGMAFVEAILKPTIVYFTQRETRRIKALADLLMPELMARTDGFMPDWIIAGHRKMKKEVWLTIRNTAKDQGIDLDVSDIPALADHFSSIYSPFENAKRKRFDRDQE